MVAPHVHRSPSDHRYRVHDGEAFIAIYEPDEAHLAEAHLQRILPKRKARPAAPVPRDLVLEVTDAPVRAAGTPQVADVDRVHVQQFSDGFRVWHPDLRTFVAGPDGAYQRREDALARARDVMVQIGTAARAKKPARRATPAPSEGLFAPRELAARGEQIGFKFNGARRGPRRLRTEHEMQDEQARGISALTHLGRAVIEEPDAFDAELADAARQGDLVLLIDLIAYREASALRETKTRGGYSEWSRVIGGYGPFKDLWRGAAVANLQSALRRGTLIPSDPARKGNGVISHATGFVLAEEGQSYPVLLYVGPDGYAIRTANIMDLAKKVGGHGKLKDLGFRTKPIGPISPRVGRGEYFTDWATRDAGAVAALLQRLQNVPDLGGKVAVTPEVWRDAAPLLRKGNGAQQPWGRRYMAPQLGTYEDLLPMGRAPSADEVRARPRRQTVADYERQSELKPNGARRPGGSAW